MKKFFILIIFLVSVFALKNLWGSQFYTSHDGQAHLARLYQFNQVLHDGQFPARWAGQFAGERGYPVFIFAYPLPYWVAEIFYFSGFNLAVSVKLVFALFYILSGLAMFLLAAKLFKNNLAALVSSILWLWAPYRFVKIFVTASLGESAALFFIPLIFLCLWNLAKKPNTRNFLYLALALSGLYLTHLITLIIFLPLMLCFAAFLIWQQKQRGKIFKFLVFSFLLSISLAAFYLLPAIYEIKFTQYRQVLKREYFNQFVEFNKLLYSPWGYGAPKFGPGELSLQLGASQWLAVVLSVLVLLKSKKNSLYLGILFLGNFFLGIFLMLEKSRFLWDFLTPLQSVDTPWRFLSLSIFCSSLLAGWIIIQLKKKYLVWGLLGVLIFLAFWGNRNHLRVNLAINYYTDQYFSQYFWVGSGWDEYRPIWLKDTYHKPPKKRLEVLEGECTWQEKAKKSNLIILETNCQKEAQVLVHLAYYPGWKIKVNGEDKTANVISNLGRSQGLLQFTVPAGYAEIIISFKETSFRLLADCLSLFGLLVFIYLLAKSYRRK